MDKMLLLFAMWKVKIDISTRGNIALYWPNIDSIIKSVATSLQPIDWPTNRVFFVFSFSLSSLKLISISLCSSIHNKPCSTAISCDFKLLLNFMYEVFFPDAARHPKKKRRAWHCRPDSNERFQLKSVSEIKFKSLFLSNVRRYFFPRKFLWNVGNGEKTHLKLSP